MTNRKLSSTVVSIFSRMTADLAIVQVSIFLAMAAVFVPFPGRSAAEGLYFLRSYYLGVLFPLFALGSYYLVERPCTRLGHKLTAQKPARMDDPSLETATITS